MNELQKEFGKCVKNFQQARKQITTCIQNAMNRGLTQKEIMRHEFKEKIHPDYEG